MKILYYSRLKFQPESLKLLKDNFEVFEVEDPDFDNDDILSAVDIAFAPLGFFFGKEKIDKIPNLKIIASNTTGHPHIDVDYASKKGVKVITLKGENVFLDTITSTAEHTWGLLLSLMRHIVPANASVMRGNWDRRPFGGRAMLSRLTLGIVGLGRLGKMVAEYGNAFRMKVVYYDPSETVKKDNLKKINSLEELVAMSDVISVHVPAEKENENMFNEKIFSRFKKGSYFINTSRSELVDHDALLKNVQNETIAGVAMDVFPGEFSKEISATLPNHPLYKYAIDHDNILITPHIGGSTVDAWRETEIFTINKILNSI